MKLVSLAALAAFIASPAVAQGVADPADTRLFALHSSLLDAGGPGGSGSAPNPADRSADVNDGTTLLLTGGVVMALGVAVIFCGIGISIASSPQPPVNNFFAKLNPTDGYVAAGAGAVIAAVGVALMYIAFDQRAEARRQRVAWHFGGAWDPGRHAAIVGLGRVW